MGQVHNELRRGPIGRAIKTAIGDSRGEGALERYGETLQPVLDIWRRPEWIALLDEIPWAVQVSQAAVALEFSAVGVFNPVGSGKLLIVEQAGFRGGAAIEVFAGRADATTLTTLAANQSVVSRDMRLRQPNGSPLVTTSTVIFGSDVATGTITPTVYERGFASATAMSQMFQSVPFICPPGHGYVIVGTVVNTAIVVNLSGREKTLLPGEQF